MLGYRLNRAVGAHPDIKHAGRNQGLYELAIYISRVRSSDLLGDARTVWSTAPIAWLREPHTSREVELVRVNTKRKSNSHSISVPPSPS
jgi:hypothetical protein